MTRQPHAAYTTLRLDARPQSRRRLDPVRGAPRERDRALLLTKPLRQLRRGSDSSLERGSTLRRQRPVRERGQLGGLGVGPVFST
ncbi:MAG TPA: hypothetical protein VLN26_02775, partial [Gaiellaceae bacterium]|nr:hypothetical protein [Gaiellaceae bacterium]